MVYVQWGAILHKTQITSMILATNSNYDIIIYGAAGFTGKLVAEYFAQNYLNSDISWAIAGRNQQKLDKVKIELGIESIDSVIADSDDPTSIEAMVKQTRAVITTVGPYQLYGEPLLKACVEQGVDYLDLCGEPLWMRAMIDKYETQAQQNGARIVFSCGFDSIPFDLGVLFLQQHAQQQFGATFTKIKGRVKQMNGTFSGGTAASFQASMALLAKDASLMNIMVSPFALTPGYTGAMQPFGNEVIFEDDINSWSAPFIMAAINTKTIHRSNFLVKAYSDDFIYDEMVLTGAGEQGKAIADAMVQQNSSFGGKDSPKPGEGPDLAARNAGNYEILFIGNENGRQLTASVSANLDPGYGSTSKMLSESSICLPQQDTKGGIWTPASAMGEALIERLQQHAGLVFKIINP